MLQLLHRGYSKSDFAHLVNVIERACPVGLNRDSNYCAACDSQKACDDLYRLKDYCIKQLKN